MSDKISLHDLRKLGLKARRNGGKLIVTPARLITPELRQSIKDNRDELLKELPVPGTVQKDPAVNPKTTSKPVSKKTGMYGRPGTALSSLIPDWATKDRSGCSCKSYAKKMDRWGVPGCETNRDQIINHLVGQKKYLTGPLKLVPDAVARAGATKLLDKAIRMAS